MIVAILQLDLHIPWAASLKDKRRVVKSAKDRLHREMMVSVAEVAFQDVPTIARLGIAAVASDGRRAGEVLDHVIEHFRRLTEVEVGQTHREIIHTTGEESAPDDMTASDIATDSARDLAEEMLRHAASGESAGGAP